MDDAGELVDAPDADVDDALRAGAAIYNAGHYHAAHDAWEDRWLALDRGTDDERLLHGLIQFTAVAYHGIQGNWSGARGLAESATEYLSPLAPSYRGINVGTVRRYLRRVAADPETLERRSPPPLRFSGTVVQLEDLPFAASMLAAPILAAELDEYDPEVIDRAVTYARAEREGGSRSTFIALVQDFLGEQRQRPLVYQRLAAHVQRRHRRETDVEGFFD